MKILLLGKNGQLGWELQRTLAPIGPLTAIDYEELDLQDFQALRRTLSELRPELIVNAAAYTNVDKAESEAEKAFAINATVPGILAEEATKSKAALIHYSTDYVFDGTKGGPYTEVDEPRPLSAYGKSKLAGEQAIQAVGGVFLIFRTAWVYSLRGDSFVNRVLKWSRQREALRIVDDQVSNPTWARMLAEVTTQALGRGRDAIHDHPGLYHLAGGGYASRFEWAQEILRLDPKGHEQKTTRIAPASTVEFPTPAQRPLFSALACDFFQDVFQLRVPSWKDTLAQALDTA